MRKQAFRVLGIRPTNDEEAIRDAFIRIAEVHSSNRSAGEPLAVVAEADERLKQVTEAYAELRSLGGHRDFDEPDVDAAWQGIKAWGEDTRLRTAEEANREVRHRRWDELEAAARCRPPGSMPDLRLGRTPSSAGSALVASDLAVQVNEDLEIRLPTSVPPRTTTPARTQNLFVSRRNASHASTPRRSELVIRLEAARAAQAHHPGATTTKVAKPGKALKRKSASRTAAERKPATTLIAKRKPASRTVLKRKRTTGKSAKKRTSRRR